MRKLLISQVLLFFFACEFLVLGQQKNQLRIDWGLQNTDVFEDVIERGKDSIRVFAPKPDSINESLSEECATRHKKLWGQYLDSCRVNSKKPDRQEFTKIKKERDGFCMGYKSKIAPVLYFDFISSESSDQYVLYSIEIEVLRRSNIRGAEGGFINSEAWYDIVLPEFERGIKSYPVHKKLTFRGNGRVQLRFWPGLVEASQGWLSRPCRYLVDVTFKFLVNGKYVENKTTPFAIDV